MYDITGRHRDGRTLRYAIYKAGGSLRIVPADGGEPTLVGRDRSLERELRTVYQIVEIVTDGDA